MSKEINPITRQFVEGFGKSLLKYRETNSISRAELARELGVGETRIKYLETADFKNIGAGGFNFGFLSEFALFQDKDINIVIEEILSETDFKSSQESLSNALSTIVPSKVKNKLISLSEVETENFGNLLSWSLEMASMISSLPDADKARLEIDLRRQIKGAKDKTRLKKLFNFLLD